MLKCLQTHRPLRPQAKIELVRTDYTKFTHIFKKHGMGASLFKQATFHTPFRSLRAIKASLSLAAQAILVRRHFALSTKVTGSGMEPRSSCCHGVYTSSRSTKPAIDPASEPAAKEEDVSSPNSTLERFEGSFICLGFSPQ